MKTPKKKTAENFIKGIRRNTRRIFSSEQKIQIVMEAMGHSSINVSLTNLRGLEIADLKEEDMPIL